MYKTLMALRTLLRKMPALGLRSPPMSPLMGPVRALLPAAGTRFMSHGGPGAETITLEELDPGRAEIARMNAGIDKDLEAMRERRREFIQVLRADIEANEGNKKALEMMMMASNAVIILSVPTTLYMLNYF